MANYELSNRIYELRTQKSLSQKELGAILGVSNKAVSKWETGTAIPKTETLIKLAEVFEISTEELLNMALPLQSVQPINENTVIPTNARIGKTLSEFRAEHGLFLKDVADKIGVSEEELQEIEETNLVPDEIANKLIIAYNLPTNDFAKPVFKSKTVTRKYFIKTAFIYEIIIGFICALPLGLGGMLDSFAMIFNIDTLEDIARDISELYYYLSPVIMTVGCIIFSKYLTEKSGYIGDFGKYKFLYATIPLAAPIAIESLLSFISGLIYDYTRDASNEISVFGFRMIQAALSLILSVASTAVTVVILAMLMNIVIEFNKERAQMTFQKIAIFVTVSSLISFVIEFFASRVMWYGGAFQWTTAYSFDLIERIFPYALSVAIVWLVYSIMVGNNNPKREKWAFTFLPLLSIWKMMISLAFSLIALGFDYLLEMLGEWIDSIIFA